MSSLYPTGPERRRHARLEHAVPVKISSGDFDIVTQTRNISCSGAFCQVSKYLAPMTKLKVHLLLPLRSGTKTVSKRIDCEGVVVRAGSAPQGDCFNTAIFFSDIKSRDSAAIARFVADKLPHGLAAEHIDGPHDDAPNG